MVGKTFVGLTAGVSLALFAAAFFVSNELSGHLELDQTAAEQLAAGPSAPVDTSVYASTATERRALKLAEGLEGPSRLKLKSKPIEQEAPSERRALRLAASSFGGSSSASHSQTLHAGRESFDDSGERTALRLAEGRVSSSERKAIADGHVKLSKHAIIESSSERRALRLAEGRISSEEAQSIADGGVSPMATSLAVRKGRKSSDVETSHFSLPDDINIDHDIVYGRKSDRDFAVQKLLRAASRITGQKYLKAHVSQLADQGTTPAFKSLKSAEMRSATKSAAASRLLESAWTGNGQKALKGLNVLTRAAQSSLDDVEVSPSAIRRGWDGV